MPALNDLGSMWRAFAEIDLGHLREESLNTPRLALVGAKPQTDSLQRLLADGPRAQTEVITAAAAYAFPLSEAALVALDSYDLRIVLLEDAADLGNSDVQRLLGQEALLVVVIDRSSATAAAAHPPPAGSYGTATLLACSLADDAEMRKVLFPLIAKTLQDRELALGRAHPGLRPAVASHLIQRTCTTNVMYAAGTGVAEMIPGLGIPFAVADIIILTKNQLVMAYKIGLTMGETGEFREALPKMAGVVGAGFMWRQVARELVGFLPLGVVLKVAIAYAGTYATGQAMYHWYATGEKLNRQQLRSIFNDALERGKNEAAALVARTRKQEQDAALPEPEPRKPRRIRLPSRRDRSTEIQNTL